MGQPVRVVFENVRRSDIAKIHRDLRKRHDSPIWSVGLRAFGRPLTAAVRASGENLKRWSTPTESPRPHLEHHVYHQPLRLLVYDTLFAFNSKFEPKPQMVDRWSVSDDKLTWTFTLRPGLKFHDQTQVTAPIASPR